MMPYNKLNTTISTCPMGLPLALKISEVTPIREAIKVRMFSRSKRQKEPTINKTDEDHNAISNFEK